VKKKKKVMMMMMMMMKNQKHKGVRNDYDDQIHLHMKKINVHVKDLV
jgi:hypothetical protein